MWTLVIILAIIGFIYSIIVSALDEEFSGTGIYLLIILIVLPLSFFSSTGHKYLSKDIRVNDNVQYNEIEYGKVDSIGYYINGKLIQYNKINKLD